VLSGLFFPGNERRLLSYGLSGRVELVIAEDVAEEVFRVLESRFADHPAIAEAMGWLSRVLGSFDLVSRSQYQSREGNLASRVRDPKDTPILACAIAARAECLVSGDKDLLVLGSVEGVALRRTREVLADIERTP